MLKISELDSFLDIPLDVEAVLAGPNVRVGDLLSLKIGHVIGTDVPAGDNVELLAGSSGIGTGELTVSGGRLALRMLRFRGRK